MYTDVANMPMPQPPPQPQPQTAASTSTAAPLSHQRTHATLPVASIVKPKASSAHTILVSPRQKGNPLLVHLSNVAYEFGPSTMLPDYELSELTCALFISLKWNMLHANYLKARLSTIKQTMYTNRIILVHVDVEDSEKTMLDITRNGYLETFKLYEKKSSDGIQERVDDGDHRSKVISSLTQIRSVNKTDVHHLLSNFGTFGHIAKASKDELLNCPGMGDKKVNRLYHVMNQPFVTSQATRRMDDAAAGMTHAQLNALHAANVAKAKEAAIQAATQKKGAIQYIGAIEYMAAPAPAATTPGTAESSSSGSMTSMPSGSIATSSSHAATSIADSSSASASTFHPPATAPSGESSPSDMQMVDVEPATRMATERDRQGHQPTPHQPARQTSTTSTPQPAAAFDPTDFIS